MTRLILKNKRVTFAIAALAICAVYFASTYHTRKLKSIVRHIQIAIRNEEVEGILTYLRRDYLDDYGYRPVDIKEFFESAFDTLDDINVNVLEKDVSRNGNQAVISISFRVVGTVEMGIRGYILGNLNQPARTDVFFKLSDKQWKITRVTVIERY
jgi:hypothetical protein